MTVRWWLSWRPAGQVNAFVPLPDVHYQCHEHAQNNARHNQPPYHRHHCREGEVKVIRRGGGGEGGRFICGCRVGGRVFWCCICMQGIRLHSGIIKSESQKLIVGGGGVKIFPKIGANHTLLCFIPPQKNTIPCRYLEPPNMDAWLWERSTTGMGTSVHSNTEILH